MERERVQLLPEIWAQVFSYVRRPLPPPNGKNERSSIRQPDLAALMRVSKLFNQLAAVPMYRVVICDDLSFLLERHNKPAAARDIPSKAILLSYISRLFLEYGAKSDPSYTTIMKKRTAWALVEPTRETTLVNCGEETEKMVDGLAKLFRVMTRGLSTLSTGAFLGGQKDIWEKVWNIPEGEPYFLANKMTRARENLTDLLHYPGELPPAFCSRVQFGPLTFISTIWNNKGNKFAGHRYRAHVDSEIGIAPAVSGGNTRWYCTFEDRGSTEDIALMFGKAVGQVVWAREGLRQGLSVPDRKRMGEAPNLTTDIYLPRDLAQPRITSAFRFDAVIKYVCQRHEIDPSRVTGDKWNFKAIEDAPCCEACSWTYKDQSKTRQKPTLPNLDRIPIGNLAINDIYHNWRPTVGETLLHTLRPAIRGGTQTLAMREPVYTKPTLHYVKEIN